MAAVKMVNLFSDSILSTVMTIGTQCLKSRQPIFNTKYNLMLLKTVGDEQIACIMSELKSMVGFKYDRYVLKMIRNNTLNLKLLKLSAALEHFYS